MRGRKEGFGVVTAHHLLNLGPMRMGNTVLGISQLMLNLSILEADME